MVVPSELFKSLETDVLLTDPTVIQTVMELINSKMISMDRDSIETDKSFRQPIPYVLVKHNGSYRTSESDEVYVLMQRMKGQGETRLHGKHYLGSGGHVEAGHSVFYTALKEVTEELGLPIFNLTIRGVLITTGGPVEDVHLCLFYTALTDYIIFSSPEKDLHNAVWVSKKTIAEHVPSMERWSQVIARDYLLR